MVTVEYALNRRGCGVQHCTGVILLGTQPNLNFTEVLKDNEIDIYLSDTITHEFLHELLEIKFSNTVCKLFDIIQECFREDIHVLEKLYKNTGCRTWDETKRVEGIQFLLDRYCIDDTDINQAFIICNTRSKHDNR